MLEYNILCFIADAPVGRKGDMRRVVIAGAGWAGCAAALAAVQAGGEAVLIEKTDTLLGTGYVGGIMRNNGRYTAAEEMIAMGGGELFKVIDGCTGAFSGSCKLHMESVSEDIQDELRRTGCAVRPIPKDMLEHEAHALEVKCCQQYAIPEFAENVILLDTGHVKLMVPYFAIEELRRIPGLANARYEDPYSGGIGNSIRFLAMAPRDDTLKVQGVDNLLCGGEKAGLLVGHTEAISTGALAGHNAVRHALGKSLLTIPRTTAVGDAISWVRERMQTEEGMMQKFTFSGSVLFQRMKERGTYTTDIPQIRQRVQQAGMTDVFAQRVA